ncbi:hypothetical protein [Burkholderia cepacia]|uniref:hypothetical protein n=1 Tax=Burkholderia cepacia TaxID=292 RepID=UPI000759919C|nr:hypothetical protein [Burkholderia cepacia]KVS70130.1 hypothetical protein WK41_19590 [Burkholderia cepacia]
MEKWIVVAELLGMLVAVIACGYATIKDVHRPLNEEEVARLQFLGNRHPEVARLIIEWAAKRDVFVAVDLDVAEREAENAEARDAKVRSKKAMSGLAASVAAAGGNNVRRGTV